MSGKRIYVPSSFTRDDWHLIHECLRAVGENLSDELERECQEFVQMRIADVLLKVQDFVIEANYQTKEAQRVDDQGMDDDPASIDVYRAVFGRKRKKQSLD